METWPTKFPDTRLSSNSLAPTTQFARTEMDSGAVKQRRRFRSALTIANANWVMDSTIMPLFRAWFIHKINAGTDWFTMDIIYDNASAPVASEVRFTSSYAQKPLSHELWEVEGELEIRDAPVMDERTLDAGLV